ncbi:MAG: PcfJ domain-containing protein [Xanthobacteraceae bacterium]|nr:PcfJ domain-containing protein [Xanthobacteraceae bacterium]
MIANAWSELEATVVAELVGLCPQFAPYRATHCARSVVAMVALSKARLHAKTRANHLDVVLSVRPLPPPDSPAATIMRKVADVVSDAARRDRGHARLDLSSWLDESGFPQFVAVMLEKGVAATSVTSMTERLAAAGVAITKRVDELCERHLAAILTRDAPKYANSARALNSGLLWLLAPNCIGDVRRGETLKRRAQAIEVFGSLATTLSVPEITAVIDNGEPLSPALAAHLNLTAGELRAFRGARSAAAALGQWEDFEIAARRLKAYSVPRHEWPGAGEPDCAAAWTNSPWLASHRTHLIRPDYFEEQASGVQDAILALTDDLLRPLIAHRMPSSALVNRAMSDFARELKFPESYQRTAAYRQFLSGVHRAIVGSRKPKAFREAVEAWHRRAASLSALRHEHSSERPGWPGLCAPWRSADGRYEIVALTSAGELVVEGNEMRHCVGGYYEICRRGDTQILSLRRDRQRSATVEIKIEGDGVPPTLRVGQFQAICNTRPPDDLHEALRDFLRAVRSGAHPMNGAKLHRYRRRMQKTGDYVWRSNALSLGHAREAYPLYRALLPRDAAEDFDDWCVESGFVATVDRGLAALSDRS